MTAEQFGRLDELTAISGSFEDMVLARREELGWRSGGSDERLNQLSRDRAKVMEARQDEILRLIRQGVPSSEIGGRLDATDKYRQGVPENWRDGQWQGGEPPIQAAGERELEAG